MRAGGVTFLLGLALIHVSLAGTLTNDTEEKPRASEDGVELKALEDGGEPKALEDGVVFVAGYVFDGDKIFAEKADSIIKYSAEVMKGCTTDECRYYTFCNKVGYDIVCLDIRLTNSTDLAEEFREGLALESDTVFKDGYIFDDDETFAEKMNSLLEYSHQVMKECPSKHCRYYTFCTKVGHDIVCLSIKLIPDKSADLLDEEDELDTAGEDPIFWKHGFVFDEDDIFSEKSKSLLKYSAEVMEICNTKLCRTYVLCNRVGYDIICLTVKLFKEVDEFIDEMIGDLHDDEPYDGHEMDNLDFISEEPEDNEELLEGKDSNDEIKAQIIENKEDEEETPKEDLSEDKVEDTPPA